jgi:hypothetical protein
MLMRAYYVVRPQNNEVNYLTMLLAAALKDAEWQLHRSEECQRLDNRYEQMLMMEDEMSLALAHRMQAWAESRAMKRKK